MKTAKEFISTKKGKIITVATVGMVVLVAGITMFVCMTAASKKVSPSSSESSSEIVTSSDDTFAAAPAISEPAAKKSSTSSNSLSVNVGASSSSKASSTASTASKKTTVSTPIKTTATLKDTNVATATPPTSKTSTPKASNSYEGYTLLDMTDFSKGSDVYYLDAENSIAALFENKVGDSSNIPKTSFGAPIVSLSSPTLLYAKGEVTLNNLRNVLINGKKYIGGGKNKYIVTGVYDNSGITYDRSNISKIDSNPNGVINSIYSKGFVSNPYSGTTSFCDGYLCTKVSDGGSTAKIGYVRALVFTLKKIS